MHGRDYYHTLRKKFEPKTVNLIIIAESPPASGKYFYDPMGSIGEPLFKALMLQAGAAPVTKARGLQAFQDKGWILIDATYTPVNGLGAGARDRQILVDYSSLHDDLTKISVNRSTPIILVKANVCRLLDSKLEQDGFNVLNRGRLVYFPSHGRQSDFHRQFSAIAKKR